MKRRRPREARSDLTPLPPITCARCGEPLVRGQTVGPFFRIVQYGAPYPHPVLSKPVMIRGIIGADGSSRGDLSIHAQLIQRAAMGGERERAELAGFENLFVDALAKALVQDLLRNPGRQG